MMIKTAALSLLLSFSSAQAEEHFDPGVLRLLKSANSQQLIPPSQSLCLNLIGGRTSAKASTKDMNDCVVALCGLPEENISVYLTDQNFERYLSPEIKKQVAELEPRLKKIIEKDKQKSVKSIESMLKKMRDPHPETWSVDFRQEQTQRLFAPYLLEKIDLKKPMGERFSLTIKDDSSLSPEMKKELKKYQHDYTEFVKTDVNSFLEKGLYSEAEQKLIARGKLTRLKSAYESIAAKMNPFEREDVARRIKSSMDELEGLQGEDLTLGLVNLIGLEQQVSSKLDAPLALSKPVCQGIHCDQAFKKQLADSGLHKALESAQKDLSDPKAKERQLNQCKAKIVAKLSAKSDQRKAEKLAEEVKKAIGQNVFSKFSAHSRKILEEYFQKKILVGTEKFSPQEKSTGPFEEMKLMVNASLEEQSFNYEQPEEYILQSAYSIAENEIEGLDTLSVCSPKIDSNAFDTYVSYERVKKLGSSELLSKMPPKDQIFISPFSCHHELRGKSVIAHELGHAINQIFATVKLSESSGKIYKKLRQCSTDNYLESSPEVGFPILEGDSQTTEEDTADILAYMAYPKNDDLFSCALIKPALDLKSYDDLALLADDGDPHSTSLYRLIMEAINKNRPLPVSCQRALEPMKEKLRLRKCAL